MVGDIHAAHDVQVIGHQQVFHTYHLKPVPLQEPPVIVDPQAFIAEVQQLYDMRGFPAEPFQDYPDCLIGTEKTRHGENHFLIGVGFVPGGLVSFEMMETFAGRASRAIKNDKVKDAEFVTNTGYEDAARQLAANENIKLKTTSDLLDELIDFKPYFEWVIDEVENDKNNLLDVYVDLTCQKLNVPATLKKQAEQRRQTKTDHAALPEEAGRPQQKNVDLEESVWQPIEGLIDDYVRKWLATPEAPHHISILGDFGAGKTSFSRQFTYKLIQQYRASADRTGLRIPIFVTLKQYATLGQEGGAEGLLTTYLANKAGVKTDFKTLKRLMDAGRLLIILDGFDEMAQKVDARTRDENFRELARLAQPPNKVILTGRPGYFPSLSDIMITFGHLPPETDIYEQLDHDLSDKISGVQTPRYHILKLNLFTQEQVDAYLDKQSDVLKRAGHEEWQQLKPAIDEVIEKNPHVRELSGRPVLLWIIVEALPRLLKECPVEEIDLAKLYHIFTNKWLERDWGKGDIRKLISMDQRRTFMQHLALDMQRRAILDISVDELKQHVQQFFRITDPMDLGYIETDIRTCTFLNHNSRDGFYKFIHRSFREFFAAEAIAAGLKDGSCPEIPSIAGENNDDIIRRFVYAMLNSPRKDQTEWRPTLFTGDPPAALDRRDGRFFSRLDGSELVYVPPGPFIFGGQYGATEQIKHVDRFFIGKYPVTQKQWRTIMGRDPEELSFKGNDDNPVEGVSWHDANEFVTRLNHMLSKKGYDGMFSLPTEVQWEKAARGIDGRLFPWGDVEPDETRCNFDGNVGRTSSVMDYPTGQSPYGLFDCAGNVWEWCADLYDQDGPYRVYRGGSWRSVAQFCRAAYRSGNDPDGRRFGRVGFRLVFVPQAVGSLSGHALEQKS